jgi:hypothetical protein
MKKVLGVLLVIGLLAGGAGQKAMANGKKVEFSLNLGVMTDLTSESSFSDVLYTLGAQADISLGSSFKLSPEVQVITYRFHFDYVLLDPGIILNFTSKGFFAGAGIILPIVVGEGESDTGKISPKFNIGYSGRHVILAGYLITDTENFFEYNLIGVSIGYKF